MISTIKCMNHAYSSANKELCNLNGRVPEVDAFNSFWTETTNLKKVEL